MDEYDDETCKKQMNEFMKLSRDFSDKHEVDTFRMISLHLTVFTLGCASINMSDESFKELLVNVAKNFKATRAEIHG